MKKLFLVLLVFLGFNTKAQDFKKINPMAKEPLSFLETMTYENVKAKVNNRKGISIKELISKSESLGKMNEEDANFAIYEEELILDLFTLTNKQLDEFYYQSRISELGSFDELNKMSSMYFESVEKTFGENALLVNLDKKKQDTQNTLVRKSFSSFFENAIDYAECLLCCPKEAFPDEISFLFKPKNGRKITTRKAEYSKWQSNKLCGFMIYDFPCLFKKARFKPGFKGAAMALLNGTPRFKQLSPNGDAVHVAMIPTIIVFGLKDLKTPPCENKELQAKLLNLVQIRCK